MDDNLERLGIPFVGSWVEKQTQDSALDGIEVREGGVEPEQQRGGCRACPRHHPCRRGAALLSRPVSAARRLTSVEPNVCVCFCDAAHTWLFGFSKAEAKGGFTSEWRRLNVKAAGDFLT